MIEGADTFFVASYVDADGQRAVDVSHRGQPDLSGLKVIV
jgi:hypothetical protein